MMAGSEVGVAGGAGALPACLLPPVQPPLPAAAHPRPDPPRLSDCVLAQAAGCSATDPAPKAPPENGMACMAAHRPHANGAGAARVHARACLIALLPRRRAHLSAGHPRPGFIHTIRAHPLPPSLHVRAGPSAKPSSAEAATASRSSSWVRTPTPGRRALRLHVGHRHCWVNSAVPLMLTLHALLLIITMVAQEQQGTRGLARQVGWRRPQPRRPGGGGCRHAGRRSRI